MTAGIDSVLSRIAEIQSLLGAAPARAGGPATDFAAALASANGSLASGASGLPGAGTAVAAATGNPTGADVVADARRYLGVPYVWGGTDPATGLDCSGLVQRVYADLGITLPRVSQDQARAGEPVATMAQAQPGDILAFGHPVTHVSIYLGGGQMIAAPEAGDRVKVQPVYETPAAIRRILPTADQITQSPLLRPAALGTAGPSGLAGLSGVPYGALFTQAGNAHGLAPALLAAVAGVESGYDPNAVSTAGALGLMQLMPRTARSLGVDPLQPAQAINGAARLLSTYLDQFGAVPPALAAYNAGPAAVRRYGGVPPYPETQSYVARVQAALAALALGRPS
ncbi:MAG: transglycosylase SLT domain-containing protein [Actinobacteria bacterium]|nr:transglycosylase SLT domain-containing protein [Actinomycetota bacterium]